MNTRIGKIPLSLLASAIVTVTGTGEASTGSIEEIVVTAEKRSASIQDVPLAVSAISGDDIGSGKIADVNDVTLKTPNVNFTQFNLGEPRLYVRGIGNSSDSAASDPAVGVFIDDIYIGRTGGSGFDLIDLQRIEVLKGPQGTLYGKNTNGGAINIITRRPTYENSMEFSFTTGNQGLYQAQALLNGGITDTVAGRVGIARKQRDGFEENVLRPTDVIVDSALNNSPIIGNSSLSGGGRLGDRDNVVMRAQLLFDLGEETELLLGADYSKDQSNGSCNHLQNISAGGPTAPLWQNAIGGLSPRYTRDKRTCATQYDVSQQREARGVSARFEHNLVWADLMSITAWRASDIATLDDLTGIPLTDITVPYSTPENVINGVEEHAAQFSQEFRLSGGNDNIDWITGVFYMHEDVDRDEEFYTRYNVALQSLGLAAEGDVLFQQNNTTTTTALYGQADWNINDNWMLTYGLRWSRDKKEIRQDARDLLGTGFPTGVPLILPAFAQAVQGAQDWDQITQRASINYRFGEDALMYLTYSEGFKSGAFPSQANTAANAVKTVDPELVKNVEAGLKSSWFDNRLLFNVAYYDSRYDDMQIFELTPTLLLVLNNAQATSRGVETTLDFAATDRLAFRAAYSSGRARFDEYVTPGGDDRSGNWLPWAPDKSGALDMDYNLPLASGGMLAVNLNYAWKGESFATSSNADITHLDAYGIWGASIAWTSSDDSLSLRAWGKNLGDEDQTVSLVVDPTGITSEKYMDPRTYGITVSKTFF
ncbi:TonB-dependent receptor [Microbulbifer sp. 2304DJ12-6]|uniref:TonB-dependent receptor n=1 Tax=Microbulbifer sp. 2304DJ12-6 TaxID=3233340 RepID=UPI0039AF0093